MRQRTIASHAIVAATALKLKGAADVQDRADVRGEVRRHLLQGLVVDLVQVQAGGRAVLHELPDRLVRLAERHAVLDEQLGNVGGQQQA